MTRTVSPVELAELVRAHSRARCDRTAAQRFLREWEEVGLVEQPSPGQWQLTAAGRAMLADWAAVPDVPAS